MNTPLGRNGLIGLAVGATAGLGLIAFIIFKEISKRRSRRVVLEAHPAVRLFDGTDGAALLQEAMDARGGLARLGSVWFGSACCRKHARVSAKGCTFSLKTT